MSAKCKQGRNAQKTKKSQRAFLFWSFCVFQCRHQEATSESPKGAFLVSQCITNIKMNPRANAFPLISIFVFALTWIDDHSPSQVALLSQQWSVGRQIFLCHLFISRNPLIYFKHTIEITSDLVSYRSSALLLRNLLNGSDVDNGTCSSATFCIGPPFERSVISILVSTESMSFLRLWLPFSP